MAEMAGRRVSGPRPHGNEPGRLGRDVQEREVRDELVDLTNSSRGNSDEASRVLFPPRPCLARLLRYSEKVLAQDGARSRPGRSVPDSSIV